jgi:uncharacterized protein YoxC
MMPDPTTETQIAVLEFRVGQLETKVDALADVPTTLATINAKLDALADYEKQSRSRQATPAQIVTWGITFIVMLSGWVFSLLSRP